MLYNSNIIAFNHHTHNNPYIFLSFYLSIFLYLNAYRYLRHDSSKIKTIPAIIEHYKGRHTILKEMVTMKYAHRDEAAVQVQKGARALLARRELARRVREKELWQVSEIDKLHDQIVKKRIKTQLPIQKRHGTMVQTTSGGGVKRGGNHKDKGGRKTTSSIQSRSSSARK